MCGIAGWVGPGAEGAGDAIDRMVRSLAARGPDGRGTWRSPRGDARFGHTRLSIIDVVGSPQPMTNEAGDLAVTYNGEIYNFRELRAELRAAGHRFRTAGDTEVLLHLYERYGAELVGRLDGMFAFGLYDARRDVLLLARDRAGMKPLYYHHDRATGALQFASDLRALSASGAVDRRLDPRALGEYLHFGYAIAPRAWLRDARQLPPGHLLEWEGGRIRVRPYHVWSYQPRPELAPPDAALTALEGRLETSVAQHLVADVPLGCFLSGGLDSATVAGLAQRACGSAAPLDSFTVRFWEAALDESGAARHRAAEIGTHHREIEAEHLAPTRELFDALVDALGEPFGDSSLLPTYLLCRRARPHVKVALSGDGGDEIFLGYNGLRKQRLAQRLRRVPAPLRRMVARASGGASSTALRRVHKYAELSLRDDRALIIESTRRWAWSDLGDLLDDETFHAAFPCPDDPFPELADTIGTGATGGLAEQQLRFHLLVDLPGDCLLKVDRMSMASGVEVRVPLLANSLLAFAGELPVAARSRGPRLKEPLRSLAERLAPSLRTPSAKRGFCFPLHSWLRAEIGSQWRAWEVSATLGRLGFAPAALDRVVARYERASVDGDAYTSGLLAARLFDLLLLAVWAEREEVRG